MSHIRSKWLWVSVILLLPFALVAGCVVSETDRGRWVLGAADYKQQVLSQPTPEHGDLKHIEWSGFGFAGFETITYLVYDPTDGMAQFKQGYYITYKGIPCEVGLVRSLEPHWYLVETHINSDWDHRSD